MVTLINEDGDWEDVYKVISTSEALSKDNVWEFSEYYYNQKITDCMVEDFWAFWIILLAGLILMVVGIVNVMIVYKSSSSDKWSKKGLTLIVLGFIVLIICVALKDRYNRYDR